MIFSLFILQKNEISNHYVLCSRWGFLFVCLFIAPPQKQASILGSTCLQAIVFCGILSRHFWFRMDFYSCRWAVTNNCALVYPVSSLGSPLPVSP